MTAYVRLTKTIQSLVEPHQLIEGNVVEVAGVDYDGQGVTVLTAVNQKLALHRTEYQPIAAGETVTVKRWNKQTSLLWGEKQIATEEIVSPPEGTERTPNGEPAQDVAGSPGVNDPMITTATKRKATAKTEPVNPVHEVMRANPGASEGEIAKKLVEHIKGRSQPNGTMPKLHEEHAKAAKGRKGDATPAAEHQGHVAQPRSGWMSKLLKSVLAEDYARDTFERHPENRHPTQEDVATMAETLHEDGQLEPLIARLLPGGQRQILSGETRWLGATKLKWKQINAKLLANISDSQARDIMTLMNAKRTDLTAIQKAQVIAIYHRPVSEGGEGKTWDEAGKIYKLTGAAAQNLVAILAAPKVWHDRLLKPDHFPKSESEKVVHQATLREIAKFAHVPSILQEIEDNYIGKSFNNDWPLGRDEQVDSILECAERGTRNPKEALSTYSSAENNGGWLGHFKCLFKIDDQLRSELGMMELPVGEKGKMVDVATNVKLYDEKNREAALKKSSAKHATAADRDAPKATKKKLTPAEEKRIANEQLEKLTKRIRNWRYEWLKELVAQRLEDYSDAVQQIASWMPFFGNAWNNAGGHEIFTQLITEKFGREPELEDDCDDIADDNWAWLGLFPEGEQLELSREWMMAMLRHEDRNPDYPLWPRRVIEDLAGMCCIDLAEEWGKLQLKINANPVETGRFENFFALHQSGQLDAVGKEVGIYVELAATKAGKVKLLAARNRVLTMPKSIAPVIFKATVGTTKKLAKKARAK